MGVVNTFGQGVSKIEVIKNCEQQKMFSETYTVKLGNEELFGHRKIVP
jgi:hypothetical protein